MAAHTEIMFYAFRYALGRFTGVPVGVIRYIKAHREELENDRTHLVGVMIENIEEETRLKDRSATQLNWYREEWQDFKEWLIDIEKDREK